MNRTYNELQALLWLLMKKKRKRKIGLKIWIIILYIIIILGFLSYILHFFPPWGQLIQGFFGLFSSWPWLFFTCLFTTRNFYFISLDSCNFVCFFILIYIYNILNILYGLVCIASSFNNNLFAKSGWNCETALF